MNNKKFYPTNKKFLIEKITDKKNYREERFAEIWLSLNKEDSPSLCVLVNTDRAFVMYLKYNGDAGYSARDLTKVNQKDIIEFYLTNGQLDKHSIFSTIFLNSALKALEYFYIHQSMDPEIVWNDDSK